MTIGEMSKKTNLPESTLRYYEKKKLLIVERDNNGRCVYSDEACYRELEMAVKRIKEKEGITEDSKSENPMLWVGKVNTIMARVEEEILREIIYV